MAEATHSFKKKLHKRKRKLESEDEEEEEHLPPIGQEIDDAISDNYSKMSERQIQKEIEEAED